MLICYETPTHDMVGGAFGGVPERGAARAGVYRVWGVAQVSWLNFRSLSVSQRHSHSVNYLPRTDIPRTFSRLSEGGDPPFVAVARAVAPNS